MRGGAFGTRFELFVETPDIRIELELDRLRMVAHVSIAREFILASTVAYTSTNDTRDASEERIRVPESPERERGHLEAVVHLLCFHDLVYSTLHFAYGMFR